MCFSLVYSWLTFTLYILQIGHGSRGDVTILPTLVVNNRQYRGMASIIMYIFLI